VAHQRYPILTYCYEFWIGLTTERIQFQVQVAMMGLLRGVNGRTLSDKVRNCKIRTARNVEPLLRIEKSQWHWFGDVFRRSPERSARFEIGVDGEVF